MVDKKVIQEWLEKADEDFEFAASVIDSSIFYAQICFHFHQSAEKYLKLTLFPRNWNLRKFMQIPSTITRISYKWHCFTQFFCSTLLYIVPKLIRYLYEQTISNCNKKGMKLSMSFGIRFEYKQLRFPKGVQKQTANSLL